MLKKLLKVLVVLDLVAVNGVAGYLLYKSQILNPKSQTNSNFQISNIQTEYVDRCGEECKAAIKAEVARLDSLPGVQLSPTVTPKLTSKPVVAMAKKVRREEIMTVPGSGLSAANAWADLAGTEFYFDTRDYPGLVEVYFEANMKLVNGSGTGYVRLFDITNAIAPAGGGNNTSSQPDIWTQ